MLTLTFPGAAYEGVKSIGPDQRRCIAQDGPGDSKARTESRAWIDRFLRILEDDAGVQFYKIWFLIKGLHSVLNVKVGTDVTKALVRRQAHKFAQFIQRADVPTTRLAHAEHDNKLEHHGHLVRPEGGYRLCKTVRSCKEVEAQGKESTYRSHPAYSPR